MAAHTEDFIGAALDEAAARRPEWAARAPFRVLEVGAGDGRLAARLAGRGYEVLAVEADARRAGLARKRGVRVVETDFLGDAAAIEPAPHGFDAVLFTRVLHHLDPLEEALERALGHLAPGGVVIGEEFDWERVNEAALAWIAGTRARAVAAGLLADEPDPPRETMASWRRYHGEEHRLHTGADMHRALSERFAVRDAGDAPYLYRYLCTRLADRAEAGAFAASAFADESRGIAAGRLPALGLRFVAAALPAA